MKVKERVFWIGLGLYTISFALPSAKWTLSTELLGKPMAGWNCALSALVMPWKGFADSIPRAICMLIAGLSNLFVFAWLVVAWCRPESQWLRRLATAIIVTIGFSWMSLYLEGLIPLVGHGVWVVGMGLMLTSSCGRLS